MKKHIKTLSGTALQSHSGQWGLRRMPDLVPVCVQNLLHCGQPGLRAVGHTKQPSLAKGVAFPFSTDMFLGVNSCWIRPVYIFTARAVCISRWTATPQRCMFWTSWPWSWLSLFKDREEIRSREDLAAFWTRTPATQRWAAEVLELIEAGFFSARISPRFRRAPNPW